MSLLEWRGQMTKVFPLHGYAVIRKYDANEIHTLLNVHFDSRHLIAICKFCDLMLEGLDHVQVQPAETDRGIPFRKTQRMTMSLGDLRDSGCYVETNLFHRPLLRSLISRCTRETDAGRVYDHGSIVITKFEDTLLKVKHDYAREMIQHLIELKIPIFAIAESNFASIIREIKKYPDRDELYEEIIYLSYEYHKGLKGYL
jgi:hypothetical protein